MTARIERVATVLAAADTEARALGLTDTFMQMAQALDDASLLTLGQEPETLARLSRVRVMPTATGAWRVRYRLDGTRKSSLSFETREDAQAHAGELRKRYGAAATTDFVPTAQEGDAS